MDSSKRSKFTIVHISDPHWICKERAIHGLAGVKAKWWHAVHPKELMRARRSLKDQRELIEEETEHYQGIIDAYAKVDFSKHFGNGKKILIHTGDTANFYSYHKLISIGDQFEEIRNKFMKLLWKNIPFDERIAIPGNHDVPRSDKPMEQIDQDKRFAEFKRTFEGWRTPFTDVNVHVEHNKLSINIWLINSCLRCGIEENAYGEKFDVVDIYKDQIDDWERACDDEKDKMRIAVMHHNPLPNFGVVNKLGGGDIFRKNGDFNAEVIRTNVKLVLSGHQHIGDEVYAAMPRRVYQEKSLGGFASPIIECGFLSSSAPTFLRHKEIDVEPGFNVVEIELAPNDNIARIKISQYRYNLPKKKLGDISFPHRVALKRLREVKFTKNTQSEEQEQSKRLHLLDTITTRVYNEQSIEPLEKVLHLNTRIKAVDDLVETYKERKKASDDNVFGIYSLSVMSPEAWWSNDIMIKFVEPFVDYAKKSVLHNNGGKYSQSLATAIRIAQCNASELQQIVSGDVTAFKARHNFIVEQKNSSSELDLPHDFEGTETFSKFGRSVSPSDLVAQTLGIGFEWDLDQVLSPEIQAKIAGRFEMARIVFWPIQYFTSDYAFNVIRFHEDFGVPLFWLNPDLMFGRPDRLLRKRELRKELGTFVIRSFTDKDIAIDKQTSNSVHSFLNNKSGVPPSTGDCYPFKMNDSDPFHPIIKLWGEDKYPNQLLHKHHPVASEIALFFRREDILFAADAWAMCNMGLSNIIIDSIQAKTIALHAWADRL